MAQLSLFLCILFQKNGYTMLPCDQMIPYDYVGHVKSFLTIAQRQMSLSAAKNRATLAVFNQRVKCLYGTKTDCKNTTVHFVKIHITVRKYLMGIIKCSYIKYSIF